MKKPVFKKFIRWITVGAIVYIAGGIVLYFIQDRILFHPEELPADHQYRFDIPFKEIELRVDDEKTLSIVQFTVPDSLCKGVVLYFHGNRQNIYRYAPFAENFTRNNYAVWMLDYPGFGKSTGKRSEKVMYQDAKRIYRMANARYDSDSIIIYGKSMGSGLALQLASVEKCRQVVLETPYYSIDALARHYFPIYPVSPMTKYSFPNHLYIKYIEVPVTIFHGTDDEIIPYRHSEKLLERNYRARLVTIYKGRHNDLNRHPAFQRGLDSVLIKSGLQL